jgi:anti-sigma factor RsiW
MTCETYEEQISALIDHELGDEQAEALFMHLGACASCRRSMQTVMDLRSGLLDATPPMAPKELDERILRQWRHMHRVASDHMAVRHLWTGRISLPVPVAAVILMFLIAGSLMVSSLKRQQPSMEGRVEAVYITTFPAVEVQGKLR